MQKFIASVLLLLALSTKESKSHECLSYSSLLRVDRDSSKKVEVPKALDIEDFNNCTADEHSSMVKSYNDCNVEAEQLLVATLLDPDYSKTLYRDTVCRSWTKQLDCINIHLLRCYAESSVSLYHLSTMLRFVKQAEEENQSDLGREFILEGGGCPRITDEYRCIHQIYSLWASDKCYVLDFKKKLSESNLCVERAKQWFAKKEHESRISVAFQEKSKEEKDRLKMEAHCEFISRSNSCRETLVRECGDQGNIAEAYFAAKEKFSNCTRISNVAH